MLVIRFYKKSFVLCLFSLYSGSRKPILLYKICSVNYSSGMVTHTVNKYGKVLLHRTIDDFKQEMLALLFCNIS